MKDIEIHQHRRLESYQSTDEREYQIRIRKGGVDVSKGKDNQ